MGAGRVITRDEHGGGVLAAAAWPRPRPGVTGVIAGTGFQWVIRWGISEGMISYRHDDGAWLNAAGDHALALATPGPFARMDVEMTPCMALEDSWI
jgi:hypothetical protein